MKIKTLLIIFIALSIYSCQNNIEALFSDKSDVVSNNVKRYSVNYSELKLIGMDLYMLKYIYPTPEFIEVNYEFIISLKDTFEVEVKNCKIENDWMVDLGTIKEDSTIYWENTEVELLKTDTIIINNSINYKYIFRAKKNSKGYISLIEKDKDGVLSSNTSHGLLIGYTVGAIDSLWLKTENVEWKHNTEEGTFSTVSVHIKGTTNAYRLRGIAHGDGLNRAIEIPINTDSTFETEYMVAFSHAEGEILKTNTKLILYGSIGYPKVMELINPER